MDFLIEFAADHTDDEVQDESLAFTDDQIRQWWTGVLPNAPASIMRRLVELMWWAPSINLATYEQLHDRFGISYDDLIKISTREDGRVNNEDIRYLRDLWTNHSAELVDLDYFTRVVPVLNRPDILIDLERRGVGVDRLLRAYYELDQRSEPIAQVHDLVVRRFKEITDPTMMLVGGVIGLYELAIHTAVIHHGDKLDPMIVGELTVDLVELNEGFYYGYFNPRVAYLAAAYSGRIATIREIFTRFNDRIDLRTLDRAITNDTETLAEVERHLRSKRTSLTGEIMGTRSLGRTMIPYLSERIEGYIYQKD